MNPRNPVILCVDDEEANLKLLANILVPRGYTVVSAASGKDALQKIKSQTIDIVLLDIIMPGMDGFEVCRQIKEDQKLRNIPVIMITVLTDKQDRIRGIEAGAEEFLSKPFDQTEALARIKILLKVKELNDARARAEEALQKSHDELDCQVQERTAELAQANTILQADITERKRMEAEREKLLQDLGERVKEFGCIADISRLAEKPWVSIEEFVQGAVNILSPAWQYPEICCARIMLDSKEFKTANFRETEWSQVADIIVDRKKFGAVTICYLEEKPAADEGPFLKEERSLLNTVADFLGHIIQHRLSEAEIRASEEKFRMIFDNANDGILLADTESKKFHFANVTICRMLGYSQDEIKTMGVMDIHPEKDIPYVSEQFKKQSRKEIKVAQDLPVKRKDGSVFYADVNAAPVEISGKRYLLGIFRDVTERKKMEAAVKASEEKYRSLVESALIGVYRTHLKGDFLYVNDAMVKMFEFESPEELISFGVLPIYKNLKDREVLIENLKNTGKVDDFELEVLTKTGKTITILMSATLDGDFISGMFIDITERKKAQETIKEYAENLKEKVRERTGELEDANLELQVLNKELELKKLEAEDAKLQAMSATRAKSDFLANMSHELRTPLNAIIGFSDMMFHGMTGKLTEQQLEYLGDIRESGGLLLSLINDILDLSKVEAGKMELELSEFNLKELIERSLVMFKEKALKHNIKVKYEVDERIVSVTADERRLKQVMFNLLSNAFKFTPDGGSVYVEAKKLRRSEVEDFLTSQPLNLSTSDVDFIEISVEDTGIGIRHEDIDKLFQPFQQLEYTLTKKYEGTGLGLTLCKRILELHNGRIWVESEVGKGSKFIFVIPVR